MSTANIIQQLGHNTNSTMIHPHHHPGNMIRLKGVPTATAVIEDDDDDISIVTGTEKAAKIGNNKSYYKNNYNMERQTTCSTLCYLEDEIQQKEQRGQYYPAKTATPSISSTTSSVTMSVSSGQKQKQQRNYYNNYQYQYHPQTEQLDDYTSTTSTGSISYRSTTTSCNTGAAAAAYHYPSSSERAAMCNNARDRCGRQQQGATTTPAFGCFQRGLSNRSLTSNYSCTSGGGGSFISNQYCNNTQDEDEYTAPYSVAKSSTTDYAQPASLSYRQPSYAHGTYNASHPQYYSNNYYDNNRYENYDDDNDCYDNYDNCREYANWTEQRRTTKTSRDQQRTAMLPGNNSSRSCIPNRTQDTKSSTTTTTTYVEIMPGVEERLRSSSETLSAIENDFYRPVTCFGCSNELLCIADASYLLCPDCRVVSPTTDDNCSGSNSAPAVSSSGGGVGMGFKYDDLFQWQSEIVMQRQQQQHQQQQY